jgi:hypothetical protein
MFTEKKNYSQGGQKTEFSSKVINKAAKLLTKRNKPLTESRFGFLMATSLKLN